MSTSMPCVCGMVSVATTVVGNGILLTALVSCAVLAWRQGFFRITLFGMALFIALVSAVTGTGDLARILIEMGLSPRHAPGVAYTLIFVGLATGFGMMVGKWVPEQAVWHGTIAGRVVAIGMAAVTASIAAGGIFVGWTMMDLPNSLMLRPHDLAWDAGEIMLRVSSRFVAGKPGEDEALLGGWTRFVSDRPGVRPACSEPFADANGNCIWDGHEGYVDIDGDQKFTLRMPAKGDQGIVPERWQPGMLDCYALGSWLDVMAVHAPRLTSPTATTVDVGMIGDGLYQATAADADPCDKLLFGLKPAASDDQPAVTIDPQTGRVDLTVEASQEVLPAYKFTVTVTDMSGLSAEQLVRVMVGNLPEPAEARTSSSAGRPER